MGCLRCPCGFALSCCVVFFGCVGFAWGSLGLICLGYLMLFYVFRCSVVVGDVLDFVLLLLFEVPLYF